MSINSKKTFTLAEVLITLGVVGVVAALTIPTLVTTINDKVSARQIEVAQKRLAESLRLYNTQEGAFNGKTYESTYDFLNNGLSKYFKMTSICDADHIGDCWPTGTINYEDDDHNIQAISASKLNTPERLKLDNDGYYAPASFISGAGIPYIIVLKKGCIIDPDSHAEDADIWACIDGLWDYQGTRQPNTLGKDVKPINMASINPGPACLYSPNGVCMATAPFYPSRTISNFAAKNCNKLKNGEEVVDTDGLFGTAGAKVKVTNSFNNCPYNKRYDYDYWLGAKLKCESMGYRLPTDKELANIAEAIYNLPKDSIDITSNSSTNTRATRGDITAYGYTTPTGKSCLYLWSGAENPSDSNRADVWYLDTLNVTKGGNGYYREYEQISAFCVGE